MGCSGDIDREGQFIAAMDVFRNAVGRHQDPFLKGVVRRLRSRRQITQAVRRLGGGPPAGQGACRRLLPPWIPHNHMQSITFTNTFTNVRESPIGDGTPCPGWQKEAIPQTGLQTYIAGYTNKIDVVLLVSIVSSSYSLIVKAIKCQP
jgi:hypothetical protein